MFITNFYFISIFMQIKCYILRHLVLMWWKSKNYLLLFILIGIHIK